MVRCRVRTYALSEGALPLSLLLITRCRVHPEGVIPLPLVSDYVLLSTRRSSAVRIASVPAVAATFCVLPGANLSTATRGRNSSVPADTALPGANKSLARERDAPAAVFDVPDPALRDAHDACRNVSVRTDTLSHVDITPLTERKHRCVKCASSGFCKKHCLSKSSHHKLSKHTHHASHTLMHTSRSERG